MSEKRKRDCTIGGFRVQIDPDIPCDTVVLMKNGCEVGRITNLGQPNTVDNAPTCEECNEKMNRYEDALDTGKGGWSCDLCGWSEDDQ